MCRRPSESIILLYSVSIILYLTLKYITYCFVIVCNKLIIKAIKIYGKQQIRISKYRIYDIN